MFVLISSKNDKGMVQSVQRLQPEIEHVRENLSIFRQEKNRRKCGKKCL